MKPAVKSFLREYRILLAIVAVKFILQYALINPYYELHRDEFLHLDQARHLAFGFISVPPLTSLFSKIIFLLGGGIFWVKFFPALFGALTIVIAWKTVEELKGGMAARLLVSFALLFSVLMRIDILFQPNSFDILAWTLILFLLVRYVNTGDSKYLWYLSAVIALGLYNKYTTIFLLAGLLAGILLTSLRKIFSLPVFWKAAAVAVILLLPNIIWQVRNDFPVIDHMRVLKETQLDNNSAAGFLRDQIAFFIGSLPLTVCALFALFFYRPFRPYVFIGITFLTVIIILSFLNAKGYYSLGIYPVVLVFGSVFIEQVLRKGWRRIVVPFLICLNLVVFALISEILLPVLSPAQITSKLDFFEKSGTLRWEDGKTHHLPQDFADMTGWKEMAEKALEAYHMVPEDELPATLVFCNNYGQTGALNYYNRGKMKEAYSFNTDYIFWIPRLKVIKNVILVGEEPDTRIANMFREYRQTGGVENIYARERGTGIFLFKGADSAFTSFFYGEAEKRKRNLDIF